jgi:thiamine transport system substrate-binding protein
MNISSQNKASINKASINKASINIASINIASINKASINNASINIVSINPKLIATIIAFIALAFSAILLTGCGLSAQSNNNADDKQTCNYEISDSDSKEINLIALSSFELDEDLLADFESENDVKVNLIDGGGAGEIVTKLSMTANAPIADAFFGVDNLGIEKLYDTCVIAQKSEETGLKNISVPNEIFDQFGNTSEKSVFGVGSELTFDDLKEHNIEPVDFGYVTINYDKKWFEKAQLDPPTNFDDLIDPKYKGLFVLEDVETSSIGAQFKVAVENYYKDSSETWDSYFEKLKQNDVIIEKSWTLAYYSVYTAGVESDDVDIYSEKSPAKPDPKTDNVLANNPNNDAAAAALKNGYRPIVVSTDSSPSAHLGYNGDENESQTASVSSTKFLQIEFAGMLNHTKAANKVTALLDLLLSNKFQSTVEEVLYANPVVN